MVVVLVPPRYHTTPYYGFYIVRQVGRTKSTDHYRRFWRPLHLALACLGTDWELFIVGVHHRFNHNTQQSINILIAMTNKSESADDNSKHTFRFVVTGFGPFNGVPDNPTSILVKELPAYLQQRTGADMEDPVARLLANCTETMIVETSAHAARQEIALLQKKLEPFASAVVLHLGVDAGGKTFKLESCAYNDATFRVPDEQGYRPNAVPILDTCSVGSTLTTSFDVPALVETMNATLTNGEEEHSLRASPSTDPGRFVCNYIYCTSMNAFACAKTVNGADAATTTTDQPRVQSLFLHVPPFEVVPKEQQLVFVTQLMSSLYQQKKGAMQASTAVAN